MPAEYMICVTHRKLCLPDESAFLSQLEKIAAARPNRIILREKDLEENAYEQLLLQCKDICDTYNVPLYANSFIHAARRCHIRGIHLPLPLFEQLGSRPEGFETVGTSVHSEQELALALRLGADYVIAGHIYETDCKAGLAGRGLSFLRDICSKSPIPVYAIGGLTPENMPDILSCNAAGGCVMSSIMKAASPEAYLNRF